MLIGDKVHSNFIKIMIRQWVVVTILMKRIETVKRDFFTERNCCSKQSQSGAGVPCNFPKPAVRMKTILGEICLYSDA